MDSESSPQAATTTVPVKIAQPEDHAPPTLAEPASGPVAEMSGALHGSEQPLEVSKEPAMTTTETLAINGATDPASQATEEKPEQPAEPAPTTTEPETISEDTEMKDDTAATSAVDSVAPDAAGTPARKTSNGKRKSTGGVPEHKNKKLSKKKSMPKMTNLDAAPGDYFFARLKSYPPWPSIVCDEEMLPVSLLSTRPVTTKKEDGTYREPYADGGKKVADRTFPVMFLHTNEFAWIPNTELAPLDPAECKDVAEKGKAKALIAAYHVAAEAHNLQYFKDMLLDHAKALQEDQEIQEAKAAEKAAKADKKKRKSSVVAPVDEDVEMDDVDEAAETKKSSKKRKKDVVESDEDEEKPAKTPKTTKIKLTTTPKAPATEKKTKEAAKASKPKSEKKKSKAKESDEEMLDSEEKEPEKPVDPVEERKAREKEVLFLRHKLQKGFLSRDQAPQEDEMPQMANYIKKLENYGELDVGIIRTTKINKVLKALIKLNTIPKDEEYNFRSRSMELLSKWNKILGTDSTDDGAAPADKDSEPATNGIHREEATEKPNSAEVTPAPLTESTEPAATSEAKEDVKSMIETDAAPPAETEPAVTAEEAPKTETAVPEAAKVEAAAESAPTPITAESTDVTK